MFEGEQVSPGHVLNFFNCEKTKIIIKGKVKNVMLSRCKKVDVTIEETMSGVEVIKCEAMKVRVTKTVKNISIELCQEVQVFPTLEAKKDLSLMTTASQSVSITFPKKEGTFDPNNEEDEPTKCEVVPETYLVKLTEDDEVKVEPQVGID